jgi:hypothetical protein
VIIKLFLLHLRAFSKAELSAAPWTQGSPVSQPCRSRVTKSVETCFFYQEDSRHFSERRKAWAAAIRGGFAAFFFFMILLILIALYSSTRKIF